MRKLICLFMIFGFVMVIEPLQVNGQVDSTCQVFGTGGTLSVQNGVTKRFYTKYVAGATYSWTITGSNATIVGPRNLHYVDVYGAGCGQARLCVSYSLDGQDPCCKCVDIEVTGCPPPPPSCCLQFTGVINYVAPPSPPGNPPILHVSFKNCGTVNIYRTEHYVNGVLIATGGGIPPGVTQAVLIDNPMCELIQCVKVCGFDENNNLICCTNTVGVVINRNKNNPSICQTPVYLGPTELCGGLPVEKTLKKSSKVEWGVSEVKISPNPATNELIVTSLPFNYNGDKIFILGTNGQLVRVHSISGTTEKIPLSGLPNGVYYLRIENKKGTIQRKFVKL